MCPAQPCLFAAPTGHAEPSGAGCIHGTGAAGPCGHDGRAACQRAPLCHVAWEKATSRESPISLQHQHRQRQHHQWLLPHAPVPAALAPTAVTPFAQRSIFLCVSSSSFPSSSLSHLTLFSFPPCLCLAPPSALLCIQLGSVPAGVTNAAGRSLASTPRYLPRKPTAWSAPAGPRECQSIQSTFLHRACWGAHLQQAGSLHPPRHQLESYQQQSCKDDRCCSRQQRGGQRWDRQPS